MGGQNPFGTAEQGHHLGNWTGTDDQAAGVHGEVAGHTIELRGHGQNSSPGFLIVRQMAAFGRLTDHLHPPAFASESGPGQMFRKAPHFAFWNAINLGNIGHCRTTLKGVERSNHGRFITAIAIENVFHHIVTTVPGQV